MSFNFLDTDLHCGGSGRSATGLLKIRAGFIHSVAPNTITINWILLDTCSTSSVVNNLDMVVTVNNCTEYEILVENTNCGWKTLAKISHLKLLPLDIHINKYYIENILSLKDVASIPVINIKMYSYKERAIIVEHGDKLLNLKCVVRGYIITQLVKIIPLNIITQLTTILLCKRFKAKNRTLPNKISKVG